jgi:hypothetical protein
MKAKNLPLAIAGSTAFALCVSLSLGAQGTIPPPAAKSQKLVTAGSFKRLPPSVHISSAPGGGEIMMSSVGHVNNPPPPPPPGGVPIDSLPRKGHGIDPGSLIFALQLKQGQRVPSTVGFWISDANRHVVFRTSLACAGCTAQKGILNLGLDAKAASAASPFMTSGNTMHLVTTTRLTEANQIRASIGVREE